MKRTGAIAAALLAAFAVFIAVIYLVGSRAGQEPRPLGDQLGPEIGESRTDYSERVAGSLAAAPADEPAFAFVVFNDPRNIADAATALEPVGRVSAVAPPGAAAVAVGESPDGPAGREQVFERALSADSLIASAVVWETGGALRSLAGSESIAAVEVLPPDAVWGGFGVRPIEAGF